VVPAIISRGFAIDLSAGCLPESVDCDRFFSAPSLPSFNPPCSFIEEIYLLYKMDCWSSAHQQSIFIKLIVFYPPASSFCLAAANSSPQDTRSVKLGKLLKLAVKSGQLQQERAWWGGA